MALEEAAERGRDGGWTRATPADRRMGGWNGGQTDGRTPGRSDADGRTRTVFVTFRKMSSSPPLSNALAAATPVKMTMRDTQRLLANKTKRSGRSNAPITETMLSGGFSRNSAQCVCNFDFPSQTMLRSSRVKGES